MIEPGEAVEVSDNTGRHRFEIRRGGVLAGYAAYESAADGAYAFTHIQIDPAHEGHGLGGQLIESAMDAMTERGAEVLPLCPFVQAWLQRHPDRVALVPVHERSRFDLPAAPVA